MVIWVSLALTSPEMLRTLQHCQAGPVYYSGFTSGLGTDSFTYNISFVGILLLNYQTKSSALPTELMAHILAVNQTPFNHYRDFQTLSLTPGMRGRWHPNQ